MLCDHNFNFLADRVTILDRYYCISYREGKCQRHEKMLTKKKKALILLGQDLPIQDIHNKQLYHFMPVCSTVCPQVLWQCIYWYMYSISYSA